MKPLFQRKSAIVLILGLWCFVGLPANVWAQEHNGAGKYYTVSGIVKNKDNRKALPDVAVSVSETNIGTVTNADGYFSLKIEEHVAAPEILFTCFGYESLYLSYEKANQLSLTLYLTPNTRLLDPAVVDGWDPLRLVTEAMSRIAKNYSSEPNLLTGFYRETAQKGRRFINISEAVLYLYKGSYGEDMRNDRVQLHKGRRLLSPKPSDTLAVKLMGGANIGVFLDVAKNPDLLLNTEALSLLRFSMGQPTIIDGRMQYVVSFLPAAEMPYALRYGKLYIDRETLAFTRAELYLDMSSSAKATAVMLYKKPAGLVFKPEELYVQVSYKQQGGKAYLSYVRNEIRFACDWKKRLFSTKYSVISEMVVTNRTDRNVIPISRKSAFTGHEFLSDKVHNFYDPDFWGVYNIIEPTESLESAVSKLKKQQK